MCPSPESHVIHLWVILITPQILLVLPGDKHEIYIVIESSPNTSHIRISSLKVGHLCMSDELSGKFTKDWMSLVNLPEFLFLKDLKTQKPTFLCWL